MRLTDAEFGGGEVGGSSGGKVGGGDEGDQGASGDSSGGQVGGGDEGDEGTNGVELLPQQSAVQHTMVVALPGALKEVPHDVTHSL